MTLRTPYDFEQDPVTHPLGEKIVSVADPFESAPGASTYYLVRRFDFAEGDYKITVTADDAASVWIGTSQLNTRIVATPTLAIPAEAYLHISQGSYRVDVILQNLPVHPTQCYFTMIIELDGKVIYTSAKEGWLLDDTAISDDDLPPPEDFRRKLPVWTVMPNWETGITERLGWQTDVLSSETDAEQRRSVRRNARRSFEVSFLRQNAQRSRLDSFFVGVGPSQFMMPLFHEQVRLTDGLSMEAGGVTFPDGEFRLREFRKGDLVLVNNGDPDDYDILEVGDVEENRFTWASPPPRPWPIGARIFPLRLARFNTQSPKMSNVTDTVSQAQVLFDCIEPYVITPSWGASIGGEPLFRFVVDRARTVDVEYGRRSYVLDNQVGIPNVVDHGRHTTTLMQASLRLFGRNNAFAFRQFLQSARGRAQSFFCPTFTQDVQPISDILADTSELVIHNQGFHSSMLHPQPVRRQLAFQFRDGAQTLYRIINNVAPIYRTNPSGEATNPLQVVSELLILDTPLPAIKLADLKRISFVSETRFDQDQFEIHHPTNGQAMVEIAIVLRQSTNHRTGNPV